MSTATEVRSLRPAIAVGVAVGIGVLASPVPAGRIGLFPIGAGAVGTVGAIAYLMLDERAVRGFGELLEDLGGEDGE